jgi:hypothetical protein
MHTQMEPHQHILRCVLERAFSVEEAFCRVASDAQSHSFKSATTPHTFQVLAFSTSPYLTNPAHHITIAHHARRPPRSLRIPRPRNTASLGRPSGGLQRRADTRPKEPHTPSPPREDTDIQGAMRMRDAHCTDEPVECE